MKGSGRALLVVVAFASLAAIVLAPRRSEGPLPSDDAAAPEPEDGASREVLRGAGPAAGAGGAPSAPSGAALGGPTLHVRVTSVRSGAAAPLPGATVEFVAGGDQILVIPREGRAAARLLRFSPQSGVARAALTDGEGRAEMAGPRAGVSGRLRVRAEGFATEVRRTPFPSDGAISVEMRPGLPVVGQVVEVDTGYTPSGARVFVYRAGGRGSEALEALSTDAEGRFRSDAYLEGAELRFEVLTDDGRTAEVTAVVPPVRPEPPVVRLEIPGRGRCAGIVVGSDGAPVAGAWVRLVPRASLAPGDLDRPRRQFSGRELLATTGVRGGVTGADGTFRVGGLGFDVDYVAFAAPGPGTTWTSSDMAPAPAAPVVGLRPTRERPEVDARLALRRMGHLGVRVTDEEGGAVRSARIELPGAHPPRGAPARTNGFPAPFRWLDPGPTPVRVRSDLGAVVEVTAEVLEGQDTEVTVVVSAGARVDGTVVDRLGVPARHAAVELWRASPDAPDDRDDVRTVYTDDEGRFEIGSLERAPWRVVASTGTATSAPAIGVTPPARGLRLVLLGHGRVVLRLRSTAGAVPADVEVRRTRGDEILHSTAAVRDGRVELDGFDGTPETVEVTAAGFAPVRFEVTVGLGETRELGATTLSAGETVAGVVLDARLEPVPGAAVVAGHHGRTFADKDGRFAFAGLPPGPLPLVVGAEGFLVLEREVAVGGLEAGALRIVLARGAQVRGVVLTAGGAPADGLRVTLVPLDGEGDPKERAVSLRTDEDGSFEVRVAPGRWRIDGGEGERVALLGEVVAVENESTDLTLLARDR